jgi:transposase
MQATLKVRAKTNPESTCMSTSLLYHACGLRGYQHVRTDYLEGEILFTVAQPRERLQCPVCRSSAVNAHGAVPRVFHSLPIGSKKTRLLFHVPRVECLDCHVIRQVALPFADRQRRYTHAFERYALELSEHMTIQDVARHLNVGWDTIKDMQKRHLLRHYSKPPLKKLRQLAIDEISVGRGQRYLTVVLDLVRGAVVFVGDGKGADALQPFWRRLRAARAKIQAVATDMSLAYLNAVRDHLPRAVHVIDHFHVIKLFNDKLSDFRRELYREATDRWHRTVLKGTRWLLLKNPDNLNPAHHERARLDEALRLNRPLAAAYYMKEDLRQIWEQPNKAFARRVFDDWVRRAEVSGIPLLVKFAATLAIHRSRILAFYDYPISTGPLEGTNNKIKTMQRQAYGYRDQEFFKLKIYALHRSRYALVG